MSAELLPSDGSEGRPGPVPSPWLIDGHFPVPPCVSTSSFLSCVYVQISSHKDIRPVGLGLTLVTSL